MTGCVPWRKSIIVLAVGVVLDLAFFPNRLKLAVGFSLGKNCKKWTRIRLIFNLSLCVFSTAIRPLTANDLTMLVFDF